MAPRGPHPATIARPQLPQARLVLGAAAASFGLFVAFHWIVLPGDKVFVDQKNRRTESVAALDPATRLGSRRNAVAPRIAESRPAALGDAVTAKTGPHAAKPVPGRAGKPIGSSPGTKHPGAPGTGAPATSEGGSPPATDTPADQSSSPPPPPPPPPPPAGLPQVPQLSQVPQLPVPTVPDLPKPQVPSVPTPPVPTLP